MCKIMEKKWENNHFHDYYFGKRMIFKISDETLYLLSPNCVKKIIVFT